jgi:putative ABC transport system permease protein
MLEDADQSDYGVITKDEIRAVLRREPYSLARLTTEDVLKGLGAADDGKLSRPKPSDLPEALGERLVAGLFGQLLSRADREPDGLIMPDEIEYALANPGHYGRMVDVAIPICLGDSYEANGQRFRVVATTPQMFEVPYGRDKRGEDKKYEFSEGRNIHADYQKTEHFLEAVIGSVVARQTGLKVGDKFRPEHGVSAGGVKHDAFEIVGVLEPTGTPNDRALFVNIEGFYVLEGHSKDNRKRIHEDGRIEPLELELREITAILVRTKDADGYQADLSANQIYGDFLGQTEKRIQTSSRDLSPFAQAVYPTREVSVLFSGLVGNVRWVLLILAWLVVVVAAVSITVGIYNSMNDRIRDIAVMRALGASRAVVMFVVLLESSLLALLGGLAGIAAAHFLIGGVMSPLWIEPQTGVSIRFWQVVQYEWLLVPGLVLLSAVAGFLPALAAYRADVGKVLSAAP